jgi:hypothetical protein
MRRRSGWKVTCHGSEFGPGEKGTDLIRVVASEKLAQVFARLPHPAEAVH